MKKQLAICLVIVAALLATVYGVAMAAQQDVADMNGQGDTGIGALGAPFTVNPDRMVPYKNYKFRVKWDGKYVPGVISISPLTRTTEVVEWRDGAEPSLMHKSPSLTDYNAIVLERGRTHDTSFEDWANKVWAFGAGLGSEVSLSDYQKDIYIELYNEAGQTVMAWMVYKCWPSEYTAMAGFDSQNPSSAIESMTLVCEGWQRDLAVVEPVQP